MGSKLNLSELVEKRTMLRKLKQSREDCGDILKDDKDRETYCWFVFDSQSIMLPTDVMLKNLDELCESLDHEIEKIEKQFADMNVDPDVD